jgi:hypothetical protein
MAIHSSPRVGGVIVVSIGLISIAAAFLWMKYSPRLYTRTRAVIRRTELPIFESELLVALNRWFGIVFFGLIGLACVIFGLVALIAGK